MSKQSKPQHFCLNSETGLMYCLFYNMCNYLAFSCYAISVGPSFFASQNLSPQRTEIKENASAFVVRCHDVRTSQGTIEDKEHDIKHFRYLSALHHPQTLPKLAQKSLSAFGRQRRLYYAQGFFLAQLKKTLISWPQITSVNSQDTEFLLAIAY